MAATSPGDRACADLGENLKVSLRVFEPTDGFALRAHSVLRNGLLDHHLALHRDAVCTVGCHLDRIADASVGRDAVHSGGPSEALCPESGHDSRPLASGDARVLLVELQE
jgi:hypothetical protein